jgi:hypothetical protein
MTSYHIWFVLFAIVAYFIATDNSVARAFYMLTQLVRVQYEKTKWWVLHNPANPIVKYLMWRRAMKLAKEIENEILNKNKS